jgi:putative membrane protein
MTRILMASAVLLGGALVAWADDTKPAGDVDFLAKAAACGNAEVKYSELAAKQATNAKVKEFARTLAEEHKQANNKLGEFARGLKTAVLAGLEKDKQAIYDDLSKRSGADFDRAYMKQMVEDHEKAIKMFEAQSKEGKHDGLKTFATDTLPKLKKHLEEARAIE